MADELTPPKVVLHVGMHKTGTSTMQQFLRKNRDRVVNHGVKFVGSLDDNTLLRSTHNFVACCLASGSEKQVARARELIQRDAAPAPGVHTVFFSSEELNRYVLGAPGQQDYRAQLPFTTEYLSGSETYWSRREQFIARVSEMFEGREVEVWATLRRPDNFCMSMYQQIVRNRAYVGTISDFAASNFASFDYEKVLGQWARHFTVRVILYEDAVAAFGDITPAYMNELGLSDLTKEAMAEERINTRSHPHIIEFLRRTNYFPLDKDKLRRALAHADKSGPEWMSDRSFVFMSNAERRAFNDRFRASCAAVQSRYHVVTPGRQTLFDETISDDREVYPGMDQGMFEAIAHSLNLVPQVFP